MVRFEARLHCGLLADLNVETLEPHAAAILIDGFKLYLASGQQGQVGVFLAFEHDGRVARFSTQLEQVRQLSERQVLNDLLHANDLGEVLSLLIHHLHDRRLLDF